MEKKSIESTPQRPDGSRLTDAAMVRMDLAAFIHQVKQEPPWQNSDRNAMTLFKTDHLRIVLVALHAGAEMREHTAEGIISVQVLEGEILFRANGQTAQLTQGQMLALHERIPHEVTAVKEAVFLLTLAPVV